MLKKFIFRKYKEILIYTLDIRKNQKLICKDKMPI